jgi:hypothetical protein
MLKMLNEKIKKKYISIKKIDKKTRINLVNLSNMWQGSWVTTLMLIITFNFIYLHSISKNQGFFFFDRVSPKILHTKL